MSEIYKFAAQNRLRFPSKKGELTVENLFQLPLKSQTGADDLDTVARTIYTQLKALGEESFVEEPGANPKKAALTVAFDVVRDVIATKQAENKAAVDRQNRAIQRKKILDAMAAQQDAKLGQMSMEELKKQLDALDA